MPDQHGAPAPPVTAPPATAPPAIEPTVPASSRRRGFHPLTVARVDPLCADAAAVTFAVPDELAEVFAFRPGQSVTVRRTVAGVEHRRSYSICAPAGAALRIGVRELAGGAVSGWLVRDLRPGDLVEVGAPSGRFGPDRSGPGRHLLIGAGSGITPLLSIAATVLADPGCEVSLLYANRRAATVMFADEVAELKDRYPARVNLVHVLSREAQEVALFSGRLDRARLAALVPAVCEPAAVDHAWLCGPYGLLTDAVAALTELGVEPSRVHRELFYVEASPPPPARHDEAVLTSGCAVTVCLDGRTTTSLVAPGTAVLDGVQRERPDLPFACKGGVCGTCRARLVSGEVSMRRNFALEDSELAAGFVLTCQAVPTSARVSLDYDA